MIKLFSNQRPGSMYLAALIAILFAPVIFWWMDDSLPRVVYTIRVENDPVTPGDTLRLRFFGDAIRNCPAMVKETITDAKKIVTIVAPREGKLDVTPGSFGNGAGLPIDIPTPPTAAPGLAAYDSEVAYTCNPVQRLFPLVTRRHVPFTFAIQSPEGSIQGFDPGLAFNAPL